MTARLDVFNAAPQLMMDFQRHSAALSKASNFDDKITELVKVRASQINGCANCLNLHLAEAREIGETEQRLDLLAAWREAPCYSERERAALEWTEALTKLSETRAYEAAYESLMEHFKPDEQLKLTLLINTINNWNRIAVGFGIFNDVATIKAMARKLSAA